MRNQVISSSGDTLRLDWTIEAPPEKVWRALTIPAYIERWLLPLAGEGDTLHFAGEDGMPTHIDARMVSADPPRRLQWHWRERGDNAMGDTLVTFLLEPTGDGGTWLRLEQQVLAPALPAPANGNTPMALAA